ncbi:thiol-disulfide oxidoreductase DCC family protein (plasmid) [Aneurinibacillus sp. Ricciae_BoGa-3]|uniref:thiol-disulfide oxidoreductase DCC family protein n=1 Tax=Aneurinibacillus sp. Ricciae_BoGa-3 TaxID=3022697 RepID=UPI0023423263|nr:thiol-disulfide oxidoreductase DCC family protein [Aneurinibacillus sp. Ricciae_BoGa-3]WCK57192.1 thiol-disulfide oxidoreductase DCC family protein [Aneurinibacillus sp. Ricciae_BoGa-3]
MSTVVLFDGLCNFCDKSVQFIIERDPNAYFHFASLQSDVGKEYLIAHGIKTEVNSLVLIENEKAYIKSSAALRISCNLAGFWRLFSVLLIIPRPNRDFFYDWFAKNRYKWFGKREHCVIPTPEYQRRFLD